MENQSLVPTCDTTLRSRWGYHPCNRETFLKLKRLHKAFWQQVRKYVAHERWTAKRPENRRGPEPRFCPLFAVPKVHEPCVGYRRRCDAHPVRVLFQQARTPSDEPVAPLDAASLKQIDDWLTELDAWEQSPL